MLGRIETLTSNDSRTKDHTPQAIIFCEPPTMISPSAANFWTPWRKLVNRGPKQRPWPTARRSISAVSRMTSLMSGGHFCDCAWYARNLAFCSVDMSFWNSETACARRISGLNFAAFVSMADMVLKRGNATKNGALQVMKPNVREAVA